MESSQPPIRVTCFSGSPFSWRVLIALEEKALAYEAEYIARASGRHTSPEMLALNPRGRLPILRRGELVLYESLAILDWLEREYPRPALLPSDSAALARALIRMQESSYLSDAFDKAVVLALFTAPERVDAAAKRDAFLAVHAELALLERIAGAPFVAASAEPTLADIALFPVVAFLVRCKLDLDARYPRLGAWYARMAARASVLRSWPPHWKQSQGTDIGLNQV
jgi:glutathione S-transferase